jgi:hypothetical protein
MDNNCLLEYVLWAYAMTIALILAIKISNSLYDSNAHEWSVESNWADFFFVFIQVTGQ